MAGNLSPDLLASLLGRGCGGGLATGPCAGLDLTSLLSGGAGGLPCATSLLPGTIPGSDLTSFPGTAPGGLPGASAPNPFFGTAPGTDLAGLLGTGPGGGANLLAGTSPGSDFASLLGTSPAGGLGLNAVAGASAPGGWVAPGLGTPAGGLCLGSSDLASILGGGAGGLMAGLGAAPGLGLGGAGSSDLASFLATAGAAGGAFGIPQQAAAGQFGNPLFQTLAATAATMALPTAAPAPASLMRPALQSSKPLKLFVGGLSQETTSASLNSYFSQFGRVSSIVMMDKATGRSRGFGFVDFVDEAALQSALQIHTHVIDGGAVTCSAYEGKGGPGPQVPHVPAQPSVPVQPTPAVPDLLQSIAHLTPPQMSPALPHVQTAPGGGGDIMASISHLLIPPSIPALPSPEQTIQQLLAGQANSFAQLGLQQDAMAGLLAGQTFGHTVSLESQLQAQVAQVAQASAVITPPVIPGRLFVGGLSQATTVESLKQAFSKFGPCETEVMMDKVTGRSRGFGFVRFRSQEEAEEALKERHIIDDKAVEVSQCMAKGPPAKVPPIRASPY
eukprot:TRINITY_DN6674_c1_g1_i1.p1 TRINITY_DN6674_c1_g1~~TRINITY_DN6674_c1_g1_i1.p1  ORF type:complete len:566 (+),score=105.00 TRINITY_DN6674_c1_g1_i1:23-1699(+)